METPSFSKIKTGSPSQAFGSPSGLLFVISQGLVVALLLTSCFRPAHKSPDANSLDAQEEKLATFTMRETSAAFAEQEVDANFNVPLSRKLTYNVCLQDKRTLESVIGHTFRIEGVEGSKDLKTNVSGCLIWSETIPFNFFANSTYVTQQRKIIATGIHSGRRTLRFAIKPWELSDNYVDLNFNPNKIPERDLVKLESASEALFGHNANKEKFKIPTWPDSFSIQALDIGVSAKSRKIKLHIELNPSVYTKASNGKQATYAFTNGLFEYHMYFVIETKPSIDGVKPKDPAMASNNQKLVVFEAHSQKPVKMESLKLKFDEVVELNKSINQGELKLAMQLIPVQGPESLAPFHGVFSLGESSTLTGGFGPKLIDPLNNLTQNFQISSYLDGAFKQDGTKIKTNLAKMTSEASTEAERENLNLVETRSFNVPESPWSFGASPDAQHQSENKQFVDRDITVKACITNANKAPLIGETFEIQSFTGQPIGPLTTTNDNGGCLLWTESFKNLSYYGREVPKEGVIVLKSNGHTVTLPVAFDPLSSTPMFDLRMPAKRLAFENLKASAKDRKIILNLNKFAMTPRGDQLFAIDRHLNLDTSQTFNFDLPAVQVLRTDRPDNTQYEGIRDGYYLLRIAIQKDFIDTHNLDSCSTPHKLKDGTSEGCERQHVTTSQKIVRFMGGHIQGAIMNFFFSDWRFLHLTSNILIELYPIDYSKLSPTNLDQQINDLNMEFSGVAKTLSTIAKFNSLIDKNSEIYTPENFIGQIVPLQQYDYDANLYLNNKARTLLICETKQCGSGFYSNVKYDSSDSDPEIAKFRLGNFHLVGVNVEDLMEVERQEMMAINTDKPEPFDFGKFARSAFSDLVMLKSTSLELPVEKNTNEVLPLPEKANSNADAFMTAMNNFKPDFSKWIYRCNRKRFESDTMCMINGNDGGRRDHPMAKTETLMVQDQRPDLENYLPKMTKESLANFISYVPEKVGADDDAIDAAKITNKKQYLEQRNFAFRLCQFWFYDYIPKQNKTTANIYQDSNWAMRGSEWVEKKVDEYRPNFLKRSQKYLAEELVDDCVLSTFKDANSVFFFEKKLPVFDFKQAEDTQPLNSFGIDISSSESVSMGISNSSSASQSMGFNPIAFVGLYKPIGAVIGLFSPFNYSWSWSESISKSKGKSLDSSTSSGITLAVDQENMRLNLLEYDSCINIRLNPAFIENAKLLSRIGSKDPNMTTKMKKDKVRYLTRGILVCSGERLAKPVLYTERYYFLRQSLGDTSVARKYDFRNNPYSFKLRGDNELHTFYALTSAKYDPYETGRLNQGHVLKSNIEQRMKNTTDKNPSVPYRQPSFPGVITID